MSDSENFLMDESSIWWVVLSDSTNEFCALELLMGFQVWSIRLDTPPGTNSKGHDHSPRAICFTLAIYKNAKYTPWRFSPSSKRLWALVSVFVLNIYIPWVEFIANRILLYIEAIFFHPPFLFADMSWASALLAVIMLSHVSNWISIWCSISLVCSELDFF